MPSFTSIDEARIRDHLERDHFFWLDITAPSHDDIATLFISGKYRITVHRDPLPPLDQPRHQLEGRVLHSEQFLLYRVLDALSDSFFPLLADIDGEIDELEADVLLNPTDRQLQRLFSLKRELVAMRKVITPQRDLFARTVDQSSRGSSSTSATTSATSMTT